MKTSKYHVEFDIEFKKNPYPGKLIAIEGIDGSGKTTQAKILCEKLEKMGYKTLCTKEPTDEPTGKFIRDVLGGRIKVPPASIQYLYGADRAVHQLELEQYLKKGYYIITDRYFWSSVAYGASDMEKIDDYQLVVYSMLSFYNQFLKPDYSFYLKVSPKTGLLRVNKTGKEKEVYENMGKLVKIEKGYEFLLKRFKDEFIIIDAEKSVEEVTEEILKKIK